MKGPGSVAKVLSANDIGETGSHQAGILVPKTQSILEFFPHLKPQEVNPRVLLSFREVDGITAWQFAFIYYNNRNFGGTRNEYRLTRMTQFLRSRNAKVGDELVLSKDHEGRLSVRVARKTQVEEEDGVLRLSGGWKVISMRRD